MDIENPLEPPPPQAAFFDKLEEAWILSHYQDVIDGFLTTRRIAPRKAKPNVWPRGQQNTASIPKQSSQTRMREETRHELSMSKLTIWKSSLEHSATKAVSQLPKNDSVDLVNEFIKPWCLTAAGIVTGVNISQRETWLSLATCISAAAADPTNEVLAEHAATASETLGRLLQENVSNKDALMFARSRSQARTFVALSCTLSALLANGWFALLSHPAELRRLQSDPRLISSAIEEFLRFACVPKTLFRRAINPEGSASLRSVCDPGERVILRIDSANRDPGKFINPNNFDISRRTKGQLSLGFGPHACTGVKLLRLTAEIATAALAQNTKGIDLHQTPSWIGGLGYKSPASLNVYLPYRG